MDIVNKPVNTMKTLTIYITPGLGNMLFQLASAYGICKKYNYIMKIKIGSMDRHKTVDYPFLKEFTESTSTENKKQIIENSRNFSFYDDKQFCNMNCDFTLYGYFQTEKYFYDIDYFMTNVIKLPDVDIVNKLSKEYKLLEKSFFIHIRRGDYVNVPARNINMDNYFKCTIDFILNYDSSLIFYIFSDDIQYCINSKLFANMPKNRLIFVSDLDEYQSLHLMSMCYNGGICSNSTFSWWGGYMNKNIDKLLFFPKWWLGKTTRIDIFPEKCIIFDQCSNKFGVQGINSENVLKHIDNFNKLLHNNKNYK